MSDEREKRERGQKERGREKREGEKREREKCVREKKEREREEKGGATWVLARADGSSAVAFLGAPRATFQGV